MGCVPVIEGGPNRGYCCTGSTAIRRWVEDRHHAFYFNGCYANKRTSRGVSIHADGRAFDVSIRSPNDTEHSSAMWDTLNRLVSVHCSLGVQRIIFGGRIWNARADGFVGDGPDNWRSYPVGGSHLDHAHIEITPSVCETLTYETVLQVVHQGFPHSTDTPLNDANADPVVPPSNVVLSPHTHNTNYPLTDTSGVWNTETLIQACPFASGIPVERFMTRTICGGRGGYLIDKLTGIVCAAGVAPDFGDVGAKVVDFLPYGNNGYYAIVNSGYTITNFGPSTGDARPSCLDISAPWERIYSPRTGELIVSGFDAGQQAVFCSFSAPKYDTSVPFCC